MFYILRVFDWIVLSSAMASVLIIILLFVKLVLGNRLGAAWHYYLWFLLLIRLLVPYFPESPVSIFNVVVPAVSGFTANSGENHSVSGKAEVEGAYKKADVFRASGSAVNRQAEIRNDAVEQAGGPDFSKYFSSYGLKFLLMLVWIAGAAIFAVYIAVINLRLLRSIRALPQADNDSLKRIFDECRTVMDIQRSIPVIFTKAVHTPSLYGFFRPRLLLPYSLSGKTRDEELKYIFLHELAHLKRKDNIIIWVAVVLKALHWFNPLIWYGFYKMRQDCELACDALTLSYLGDNERKEYGYTILNLIKMISKPQRIPGMTGMASGESQMKRRITMISMFRNESIQWTLTAVILFLVIGVVGLTDARQEKDINELRRTIAESNTLYQALNERENRYRELDSKYNELQRQVDNNNIMSGMTDVEGQGIVVTISDGDASFCKDMDIRNTINELMSARAEALSINNERFVSTSEIRSTGAVILINGREYSSPFIVKAIGNPDTMERALKIRGGIEEKLRAYSLGVKIEKTEKLFIPKYNGEIQFKYAQPVEAGSKE